MKKHITPVIALFAICVAVTALVACANSLTKDTIASNAAKAAQETMRELIADAAEFTAIETSAEESYVAKDKDGAEIGYIFVTVSGKGYGGDMTVMTALDVNGIVMGLEITADEETQGLGKNAHNENYRDQYVGKETDSYTVVKGEPTAEGDIQALTGATKTSNGVTEAVNLAKQALRDHLDGGEKDA